MDKIEFWPVLSTDLDAPGRLQNHCILLVSLLCLYLLYISLFLQVTRTPNKGWISFNASLVQTRTAELAAFERPGKFLYTFNGINIVTTSFVFVLVHVTTVVSRKCIKAFLGLNFYQIWIELALSV